MSDASLFTSLVSGSHAARFRAVAPFGFQTGDSPNGFEVDVIGGSITFDATADVWATGTLTVNAAWPGPRETLLSVFGGEVFLSRGVGTCDEDTVWSPLGYFRITALAQEDAAKAPLALTLDDRMQTLIEARVLSPRVYAPGQTVAAVVEDLVREIYPDIVIEYDSDSGDRILQRQIITEESRFEPLRDIADATGQIVYFDSRGILRFADIPLDDQPVWVVKEGVNGVQVRASRTQTRVGVFNAVVARGEGMDDIPPVQAVAFDASPQSPTHWDGPFGRIPRFYASPMITTRTQARNAAVSMLRRFLGAPYTVTLQVIPNPGLRPYDPIRVIYNDGFREDHVTETYTIPLDVDTPATIGTREQSNTYVRVE